MDYRNMSRLTIGDGVYSVFGCIGCSELKHKELMRYWDKDYWNICISCAENEWAKYGTCNRCGITELKIKQFDINKRTGDYYKTCRRCINYLKTYIKKSS